jgi:hypothetical protein
MDGIEELEQLLEPHDSEVVKTVHALIELVRAACPDADETVQLASTILRRPRSAT